MHIKIKGDDAFGLAYPKENLIKLFYEKMSEIENEDELVEHIYMSYMMMDFFMENVDKKLWEKKDNDSLFFHQAVIEAKKRCYDIFLSWEPLTEATWDRTEILKTQIKKINEIKE